MIWPLAVVLALLFGTLGLGIWIGIALFWVAVISLDLFRDIAIGRFLASDIWGTITGDELVTLPLFILMGEILFHTRLSENLFNGLAPWTRRLPGRLLHVNVVGSALFSAGSGSSAAGIATVGRITLKELKTRGYDDGLAIGSLVGAGTLGFLIPPSIPMIVYGVLANVSILDLFIAGIIPGAILMLLYMLYIAVRTWITPSMVGAPVAQAPLRERLVAFGQLLPVVFLMAFVMGSMFTGWASITEAAAVGVLGAILIGLWQRSLTPSKFWRALLATVRTCSMIALILLGALFLSKVVARLGIPAATAGAIAQAGLHPYMLILLLMIVYLVLGTVLDGLSAIVMTLSVTLPLVVQAGYDPIWFGVFLVITAELAQVSPPVGINLSIIQNLTGYSQNRVAYSSLPFCLILLGFTALITVFPEIVTFGPKLLK